MSKLNLTPEQIEMLRKGYRRAQEIPEGFSMSTWGALDFKVPCGTVCCYAGELLIANGGETPQSLAQLSATVLLGVPSKAAQMLSLPYVRLRPLFHAEKWPDELYRKYQETNIPKVRVETLTEVVERFIAADGDTSNW